MDLGKKRILLIPLDGGLTDGGGPMEFRVSEGVLDRICTMNVSRVVIIISETEQMEYQAKVKAVEFMVFAYCKVAVCSRERGNGLIDEVMADLPQRLRKRELFLSVGEHIEGIDYIGIDDFGDGL